MVGHDYGRPKVSGGDASDADAAPELEHPLPGEWAEFAAPQHVAQDLAAFPHYGPDPRAGPLVDGQGGAGAGLAALRALHALEVELAQLSVLLRVSTRHQ